MSLYITFIFGGIFLATIVILFQKNRSLKEELRLEIKSHDYCRSRNDELVLRINAIKRECELKNDLAKRNQERLLRLRDGYISLRSHNEYLKLSTEDPTLFEKKWNNVPFAERAAFRAFAVKELEEKYGVLVG